MKSFSRLLEEASEALKHEFGDEHELALEIDQSLTHNPFSKMYAPATVTGRTSSSQENHSTTPKSDTITTHKPNHNHPYIIRNQADGVHPVAMAEYQRHLSMSIEDYQRYQLEANPNYTVVVALAAVITCREFVLLKRRISEDGDGKWTLFGGKLGLRESLREATAREINEEIDLDLDVSRYWQVCFNEGVTDLGMPFVIMYSSVEVTEIERSLVKNMEPTKCSDLMWFHYTELPPVADMWIRDRIAINKAFFPTYKICM